MACMPTRLGLAMTVSIAFAALLGCAAVEAPPGARTAAAAGTAPSQPAAAAPAAQRLLTTQPQWKPRFQGVALADIVLTAPRPLRLHLARVELRTPGLRWLATPAAEGASIGSLGGLQTRGLRTSSFLLKHQLQLAINAAPFGPVVEEEGQLQNVAGLQISQGKLVSGAVKQYPALLLRDGGPARVVSQPFPALQGIDNAVGGFDIVLQSGLVRFAPDGRASGTGHALTLHPRTAAGVSVDGQTLWLLVADGRQAGYSEGLTLHEIGRILRELGASDGINLDGGGTTTLVVQGRGGNAEILNRPIHGGVPGRERVSASHLGLWAPPLN